MKIISPTESFWDFSNHLYRRPGVEEICLKLQDHARADVNMVLFACWYGATRGPFPDEVLSQAQRFSTLWTPVVSHALRNARRWMKKVPPDINNADLHAQFVLLRKEIKRLELQAEQFHENMLEAFVSEPAAKLSQQQRYDAVAQNLARYAVDSGLDTSQCNSGFQALVQHTMDAGLDPVTDQ